MLVGGGGEGEREGILTTLLLIDSRPVGCVWHKYGIMSLSRKISAALDFGCRSYSIRAQVISVNYLAAAGRRHVCLILRCISFCVVCS